MYTSHKENRLVGEGPAGPACRAAWWWLVRGRCSGMCVLVLCTEPAGQRLALLLCNSYTHGIYRIICFTLKPLMAQGGALFSDIRTTAILEGGKAGSKQLPPIFTLNRPKQMNSNQPYYLCLPATFTGGRSTQVLTTYVKVLTQQ